MRADTKEKRSSSVGIQAAAAILDCHPDTVRRLIRSGKLDAFTVGRDWRIAKQVLREFMRLRDANAAN